MLMRVSGIHLDRLQREPCFSIHENRSHQIGRGGFTFSNGEYGQAKDVLPDIRLPVGRQSDNSRSSAAAINR